MASPSCIGFSAKGLSIRDVSFHHNYKLNFSDSPEIYSESLNADRMPGCIRNLSCGAKGHGMNCGEFSKVFREEDKMSRLILIRHGETLWNREYRLQGTSDTELSEKGRQQAETLAATFPGPVHKIYLSPQRRAVQSGAPLAARFNLEPEVLEELREMSFGRLEGLTYSEMDGELRGSFDAWLRNPSLYRVPGGESLQMLSRRVGRAVSKMTDGLEEEQTVVAVSHGGVIRMAVLRLLSMRMSVMPRLRIDLGSVTILERSGGIWRLVLLNDTCPQKSGD
jgi:alpha-ribazole phosphatase/probable phosphoglycerate mutase